jgi:hypothetical protein
LCYIWADSGKTIPPAKAAKKSGGHMREQLRKSITTLVFVVGFPLAWAVFAQAPQSPLTFKPDAPDRYIVVPGDTLWGISQRYTDSPWRWAELWNMNKEQVKNPHRIYPGDVIVLDRSKGQLALDASQKTIKLSPSVRAGSLAKQELPSIPPGVIEPFLTRPLVVEPDGLDNAPTIVGTEENRVVLGAGNIAFVRGIAGSKEQTWYVYRRGNPLVDPDTNRTLGYEAIYLGTAQVTRSGDPTTVQLINVVQEVGSGDKLVPAGRPQLVNYAPRAPTSQVKGRVMGVYGGIGRVGEAGTNSIITINRGKADGLDVDSVVALYSAGVPVTDATRPKGSTDSTLKVDDERYGLAFVFRAFDRISYALVMRISRPVRPLDVVQNP